MRDIIKDLNKSTLSSATGISYSRLRKYAAGTVAHLTPEEKEKVRAYLLWAADQFKN